jgi:TonB family protein
MALLTACAAAIILAAAPLPGQPLLEIISPSKGMQFHPGETVTITVRTTRTYETVGIITEAGLPDVQEVGADPRRFSLLLPPGLDAGFYTITAVGAPGSPDSVGFDASASTEIDVEPIWSASDDASHLVHDAPGVTVDTGGIPLRHRSAISYPSDALAQGIEGTVVAEILPDWHGIAEGVHVLSGPVQLARHVIRSVSTWHYIEHVGSTKPRRVSIAFSLAGAKHPTPSGGALDRPLADNTTDLFRSVTARSRRFVLGKISVVGLTERGAGEVMRHFEEYRIREGVEIPFETLYSLPALPTRVDEHLHTYLLLDGSHISATITPVTSQPGDWRERPALKTERVPPGEEPLSVNVSAADQARRLIFKVPPEYPWEAKDRYIQGAVRVQIMVGKDGRVTMATASGPSLHLSSAAEEAVKQWIYSPTVINGYPVEVITEAWLDFFLPY